MFGGIIQEFLVKKLISEDHPTIEYNHCTNSRQSRKPCTVCKDVCPKDVIDPGRVIDWDNCGNCNICVSQCPSRAIKSSAINLGKLLELYESNAGHLVIACRHRESGADLKLYCLASTPWEVIAYLALEKQVVILQTGCEDCADNGCLSVFRDTMGRVELFLGKERFDRQIHWTQEELPAAPLMSRREMFSLLGKRARNMARKVIPDDGSVPMDGMIYRRLLTKRLKGQHADGGRQVSGWNTRVFTERCWGCGICAKVCPHGALAVVEAEGHRFAAHALWKCESCGICESVCLETGMGGVRVAYVTDPTEPVLTELTSGTCSACGGAVKPGTGELCYHCAVKRKHTGSPFIVNVPY